MAGEESLRAYERYIMLNIDRLAVERSSLSIDQVKQGIGLVGYGQKDPLVEYKKQSFDMFQDMLDRIDTNTTKALFNLEIVSAMSRKNANVWNVWSSQRARKQAAGMAFTGAYGYGRRSRSRSRSPHAVRPRSAKGKTERSVLLRFRQEIQKMPRSRRIDPNADNVTSMFNPKADANLASAFYCMHSRIKIRFLQVSIDGSFID